MEDMTIIGLENNEEEFLISFLNKIPIKKGTVVYFKVDEEDANYYFKINKIEIRQGIDAKIINGTYQTKNILYTAKSYGYYRNAKNIKEIDKIIGKKLTIENNKEILKKLREESCYL